MRFLSNASLASLFALAASACGMATTSDSDSGPATADVGTDAAPPAADAGIDGSTPIDAHITPDTGIDAGHRVPMFHRADDSQCGGAAPAGNCSFGGGGAMCSHDSDCMSGTNGRCNQSIGGAVFCGCTYDTCTHDSDCPTGNACACHGATYHARGNECLPGNCRVDSDCGTNGFCSPNVGGCGGLQGYYCHTASDTCIDDADCAGAGIPQICQFHTDTARWQCTEQLLCG